MKIKIIFALMVAFCITIPAAFAEQLKVASDSSSGTYNKHLGELIAVCNDETLNLSAAPGIVGGAVGNLDALFNNKADAAFLHSDVFFANSQADPSYQALKTLVALWPEPIHIVALRESKTSRGKVDFRKKQFNTSDDLRGFKIGAAGGGVLTGRILTGQGQGGFSVIDYGSGDKVIAALNNGDIAAAIFVGAAPLPNLEKLPKNMYKILPISPAMSGQLKGVYREATVNYPGITNGPVRTLAPLATMLTRKFSTPKKVEAQRQFRACFNRKLGELQDEHSRIWQQVDANDHGVLNNWLELSDGTSSKTAHKNKKK